ETEAGLDWIEQALELPAGDEYMAVRDTARSTGMALLQQLIAVYASSFEAAGLQRSRTRLQRMTTHVPLVTLSELETSSEQINQGLLKTILEGNEHMIEEHLQAFNDSFLHMFVKDQEELLAIYIPLCTGINAM